MVSTHSKHTHCGSTKKLGIPTLTIKSKDKKETFINPTGIFHDQFLHPSPLGFPEKHHTHPPGKQAPQR